MQVSFIKLPGNDDENYAFVSFEKHRTCTDIASILYSEEFRSKINASKALLIRPPVDIPLDNLNKQVQDYKIIMERFPLKPLYLLYSI